MFIFLLTIVNIFDLIITSYYIGNPLFVEANPIARIVIENGGVFALCLYKIGLMLIFIPGLIWFFRHKQSIDRERHYLNLLCTLVSTFILSSWIFFLIGI